MAYLRGMQRYLTSACGYSADSHAQPDHAVALTCRSHQA